MKCLGTVNTPSLFSIHIFPFTYGYSVGILALQTNTAQCIILHNATLKLRNFSFGHFEWFSS